MHDWLICIYFVTFVSDHGLHINCDFMVLVLLFLTIALLAYVDNLYTFKKHINKMNTPKQLNTPPLQMKQVHNELLQLHENKIASTIKEIVSNIANRHTGSLYSTSRKDDRLNVLLINKFFLIEIF